jgi:CubicO group peptidase (beta-lactamase class C family)
MITKEMLLKNMIIHKEQGYALYCYYNGNEIMECSGKLGDSLSDDITFDSNFRLASVSKQFIAFAIVNLINQGDISFDTKITSIFNQLPCYFNDITIKHLLNHTSGIYDYEDMEHDENIQIVDEDIIDFLLTTNKTYFEPGSTYRYSNTGYILLGLIVSKVTNRALNEYIETEIFKKALMFNSKANIQGKTIIDKRAYGHIIDEKNNLIVKDQYWCSATIGDGGLYSSINDLKKWVKYLVSTENFKLMKEANYIKENDYNEYGLGLRNVNVCGKELIYHTGSTIGTNTLLLFSIDFNLCVLFLTNINNNSTTKIKDHLVAYFSK